MAQLQTFTTADVMEALHCSKYVARKLMREYGGFVIGKELRITSAAFTQLVTGKPYTGSDVEFAVPSFVRR